MLLKSADVQYLGPVFGDSENPIPVTNEFCVKLKSATAYSQLLQLVQSNGCELVGEVAYMPLWYTIKAPLSSNSISMSNRFYETGLFEKVDPLFVMDFENHCVSDPLFNQQWGLQNPNGKGDIKACQAWEITKGSSDIVVAVYDSGLDTMNLEIMDNILPYRYNTHPQPFGDIHDYHGTFIAGIIAAKHNDSQIAGIAPNSKLISIIWLSGQNYKHRASCINFAVEHGAHIINNSWGHLA